MDHATLVDRVVTVAKTGLAFGLPIILSTVNVGSGANKPTVQPLLDLVIAALWTEARLTFPSLDAMRAGFEVFPVVDAVYQAALQEATSVIPETFGGHPHARMRGPVLRSAPVTIPPP